MKIAALLFLAALPLAHAIDFSPTEVKERGEGGEYIYLKFKDGKKEVTYMPPKRWEYTGGAIRLRLTPNDAQQTDIDITVIALDEPLPVETTAPKVFEELAHRTLPEGASKIETVAVNANPLEIDGKRTVEVVVNYVSFGQAAKASFLYLSRGKELMRFRVIAKPSDFDRVKRTFHASLHTIAGL